MDYTTTRLEVNSWCSSMVEQLSYKQVGADFPEVEGSNPSTSTILKLFKFSGKAVGTFTVAVR